MNAARQGLQQGWASRFAMNIARQCLQQGWSSRFAMKAARQGLQTRLVVKVCKQGWASRFAMNIARQGLQTRLGANVGYVTALSNQMAGHQRRLRYITVQLFGWTAT